MFPAGRSIRALIFGLVVLLCFAARPVLAKTANLTIVVLGSSTAAGAGANPLSMSWAGRFDSYLRLLDPSNRVVNLGAGGFTTYNLLPTGTIPPPGRPWPDTQRNISTAVSLHADAIIVNIPTNDTASGFSKGEQQTNYRIIAKTAQDAGIPLWFSTTQPRNLPQEQRDALKAMCDWILATYGQRAIDFWTDVAAPDGSIVSALGYGDGVHLNNAGHAILFARVLQAAIPEALNSDFMCPALTIGQPADALVTQPYTAQLGVVGAAGPCFYVATELPEWLTLSPDGMLAGTPPTSGDFSFVACATDVLTSCVVTQTCTLHVGCPPFTVDAPNLPGGVAGKPYITILNLLRSPGGPSHRYVYSGTLPPGLTLLPDGTITGTPTQPGPDHFTVTVTDTVTGCQSQPSVALTIGCPPITLSPSQQATTLLDPARAGQAYTQTISASEGSGSYTFGLLSGTLPNGLVLGPAGASTSISGVPSTPGTYVFQVQASDAADGCTGAQTYQMVVTCPPLTISPSGGTTTALPDGGIEQVYSQTIHVGGGSGLYPVTSANLPAWLTVTPVSGDPTRFLLAGTPDASGDFAFTVTATDGNAPACSLNQAYTLHIAEAAPKIVCPANIAQSADAGRCSAIVPLAIKATGTPPPTITYTDHGTGTAIDGTYAFQIGTTLVDCVASNATGPDATCSFAVTVSAAPLPAPPAEGYMQGFEVNLAGWNAVASAASATRVASGTHGIASESGDFHAEAPGPFNAETDSGGAVTDFGGYRSQFYQGGYTTQVSVYLDPAAVLINDTRFNWDSAINDPSGALRRDFVFNAGGYTDTAQPSFVISASTLPARNGVDPRDPAHDPFSVTTAGWYTLRHRFYDNNGVLAVDLSVLDGGGTVLHTWTLSDPSDSMCGIGGNRTGSFSLQEFPFVAFDDVSLAFNNAALHTFYRDADGDGYGDAAKLFSTTSATPPAGYVADNTDCNDADPAVHAPQAYYRDLDRDGFGDLNNSILSCSSALAIDVNGIQYVTNSNDCDDSNPLIAYPVTYYKDADADGYGDPSNTVTLCSTTPPPGYVRGNTDCNDSSAAIHPGAKEITNGLDDNCNGLVDEGPATAIDFERLTDGALAADSYADIKVRFEDAVAVQDRHPLQNYFPPSSGTVAVTNGVVSISHGAPYATIGFYLDNPAQAVWAYVTAKNVATLTAYDAAGNVIGSASTTPANFQDLPGGSNTPNQLLRVSSLAVNISKVVFSDSADEASSFTVDDLSFSPAGYPNTIAGALRALRIAAGIVESIPADAILNVEGTDSAIGISDALRLVRRAAGLD